MGVPSHAGLQGRLRRLARGGDPDRLSTALGGARGTYDPWSSGARPSRDPVEVIDFGRYAGWRIADLVRHDPDYLRWLSRHSSGVRFLEAIARHLPGDASIGRRSSFVGG